MSNINVFNFNIGILGHVDSGKTTLAKALSTVASTAAFDKNPQSQERGITLDLGFSSFSIDTPDNNIKCKNANTLAQFSKIQFTLVDCPGHASLIKTVIGGSQIIDMVLLVVDAQKGIQTQTAECLVLCEITCPQSMIVVLNKVDLFEPGPTRQNCIEKIKKRLLKTLEMTVFKNTPIVPVSCVEETDPKYSVSCLISAIVDHIYVPERNCIGMPTLFSVDHCFGIKGQGTVMTGTIISGQIKVNDQIEIPALKEIKKVKSMQIFRQPVEKACQGDRVAICVSQFDAKTFERGLVCSPQYLQPVFAVLVDVQKVRYYKHTIASKNKFHISIGHETVLGRCTFFQPAGKIIENSQTTRKTFDFEQDYLYLESAYDDENEKCSQEETTNKHCPQASAALFCLLEFDHSVLCPPHCLYIASKLDLDQQHNASLKNTCRLAFYGHLLHFFADKNYVTSAIATKLRVYKVKRRQGTVDRMTDELTVIASGLFKKHTNMDAFINLKVTLSTGELGSIEGHFGQSGKAKIRIAGGGLLPSTVERLKSKAELKKNPKSSDANAGDSSEPIKVLLEFKRYIYDPKKAMLQ